MGTIPETGNRKISSQSRAASQARPLPDRQAVAVLHHDHAFLGHRRQRAVHGVELLVAVHRPCAGLQPRWVDHVPGAAWVHQELRLGQLLHQQPRAAGVIEMNVGDNHVSHLLAGPAAGLQQAQHVRHRGAGPGFYERHAVFSL